MGRTWARRGTRRKELPKLQFATGIHWRRGKFVGPVSFRRMVHLRPPAILLQALVRFRPARQFGTLLGPMDHGGFVAPLYELAHGLAVSARSHKLLHGRFAGPDCAGPEGVPPF